VSPRASSTPSARGLLRHVSFEEYEELSEGGTLVPVFRELPGDVLTPVSAFLALEARSDHAFLLESIVGGEQVARYSFLGSGPGTRIVVMDGVVHEGLGGSLRPVPGDLLSALRARVGPGSAEVRGLPRFTGGAVGFLAYDAVRLFEKIPARHAPSGVPQASFSLYKTIVAFDHVLQRIVLIADTEPGSRRAFEAAQDSLDGLEEALGSAPIASSPPREWESPRRLDGGPAFRKAVGVAKAHIAAGDIFQVVLSLQRTFDCPLDPFSVYRALRMVNPSPYMYFLKDGGTAVAGASPEMLVRVEGERVETRPIAGTRPRGANPDDDDRLALDLLADPKECAEHLMLVDLARNDIGKVCRFGSVAVPSFMGVEKFSHVAHIVSSVVGELAPGHDALDALAAAFPAGTLSGAPKIRAMEIIDALETSSRGLYGGALGYVDLRGNLDFCIAIRTLVFREGKVTVQAGAGIVADSDPDREEQETEAKARALFEALALAQGLR
jgi:anthranilate synthase component 1